MESRPSRRQRSPSPFARNDDALSKSSRLKGRLSPPPSHPPSNLIPNPAEKPGAYVGSSPALSRSSSARREARFSASRDSRLNFSDGFMAGGWLVPFLCFPKDYAFSSGLSIACLFEKRGVLPRPETGRARPAPGRTQLRFHYDQEVVGVHLHALFNEDVLDGAVVGGGDGG